MSNDVTTRLSRELLSVEPSPAPVTATIRNGRALRRRRQAALTGGIAAIAAIATGSALLIARPGTPPPVPASAVITVNPGSSPGTIASGRIGNKTWRIYEDNRGCVYAVGAESCATAGGASAGIPVVLDGIGDSRILALFGPVTRSVDSVLVQLSDGAELTLHPVPLGGQRMVGFALPMNAGVTAVSATAYTATGAVIATAIPYQDSFITWLRPGQRGYPRASGEIGSGSGWRAYAHTGPWGVCFVVPGRRFCSPVGSNKGTGIVAWGGSPVIGVATPSVAYVEVVWGNSAPQRVPIVQVGPVRAFAFTDLRPHTNGHWTAYSTAGQVVASGALR